MKTILIVDDEFLIAETLSEVVSSCGYQAIAAANGEQGLAQARAHRPALVLLDYMMPILDGLQTLDQLRADPVLAGLPVIMMTAAPKGLPSGRRLWDELLLKPFDADQLIRAIQRLIGAPEP
jgi:two-component system response regulator VicR